MIQEVFLIGFLIFSLIFLFGFLFKLFIVFTTDNKKLSDKDINFKKNWTLYKRGK